MGKTFTETQEHVSSWYLVTCDEDARSRCRSPQPFFNKTSPRNGKFDPLPPGGCGVHLRTLGIGGSPGCTLIFIRTLVPSRRGKDHYLIKIPFSRCGSRVLNEDDKLLYPTTIMGGPRTGGSIGIEIPVLAVCRVGLGLEDSALGIVADKAAHEQDGPSGILPELPDASPTHVGCKMVTGVF
ncbi:unnamed protein product, partial [Ranitomeya imitator]